MFHDLASTLTAIDSLSMTVVLIMCLIGAYYLNYVATGPVVGILSFFGFIWAALAVLAVMRYAGFSFTQIRGGDAVIASATGMILATLALIAVYTLFSRDRR